MDNPKYGAVAGLNEVAFGPFEDFAKLLLLIFLVCFGIGFAWQLRKNKNG